MRKMKAGLHRANATTSSIRRFAGPLDYPNAPKIVHDYNRYPNTEALLGDLSAAYPGRIRQGRPEELHLGHRVRSTVKQILTRQVLRSTIFPVA